MCLEKIAPTVGQLDMTEVTIGWIQNTMELGYMALTANLRHSIEAHPGLEIIGGPEPMRFDASGNLARVSSLFAGAGAPFHAIEPVH